MKMKRALRCSGPFSANRFRIKEPCNSRKISTELIWTDCVYVSVHWMDLDRLNELTDVKVHCWNGFDTSLSCSHCSLLYDLHTALTPKIKSTNKKTVIKITKIFYLFVSPLISSLVIFFAFQSDRHLRQQFVRFFSLFLQIRWASCWRHTEFALHTHRYTHIPNNFPKQFERRKKTWNFWMKYIKNYVPLSHFDFIIVDMDVCTI